MNYLTIHQPSGTIIGVFAASRVGKIPHGFSLLEADDELLDVYFSLKQYPADVTPLDVLLNASKTACNGPGFNEN